MISYAYISLTNSSIYSDIMILQIVTYLIYVLYNVQCTIYSQLNSHGIMVTCMPTILRLVSCLIVLSSQISIHCSSNSSSSSSSHRVTLAADDNDDNDDRPLKQQRYLYFDRVIADIGPNIGMHVKSRVLSYLHRIDYLRVQPVHQFNESSHASVLSDDEGDSCSSYTEQCGDAPVMTRGSTLILSLGNTDYSLSKIPQSRLVSLPAESFQIQFDRFEGSPTLNRSAPIYYLVCNGLPLNPATHTNVSFDKQHIHYGAVVCAYDALERLGYAFLHPLEPFIHLSPSSSLISTMFI